MFIDKKNENDIVPQNMIGDIFGGHHVRYKARRTREQLAELTASRGSNVRVARCRNKSCGIPDDVAPSKVATGSATKGRELMDDKTKEIIQAKWLEVVGKQTGFQDYNELRCAFKMEKMNKI